MSFILKDEAIFIADSHYNKKNQEFKIILEKIKNSEIFCSQIFLMGDNFDFLSNEIKYFKNSHLVLPRFVGITCRNGKFKAFYFSCVHLTPF